MSKPPSLSDLDRLKKKKDQPSKRYKVRSSGGEIFEAPKRIKTIFERYSDNQYPLFSVHGTPLPNTTFIVSQDNAQSRKQRIILDYNTPFQDANTYYGLSDQQLYRLQQKDNYWLTNNLPASSIIEHSNDDKPFINKGAGEDVDLVIVDEELWHGCVEFNSNVVNAKNPQDYKIGNALRDITGSGGDTATCQVLDIYLDGPAYLDPEFFYNPANSDRIVVRWDGTRMPACSAASDWWNTNSLSARSPKFVSPSNGGTATGDNDFGNIYYDFYDNKKNQQPGSNTGLSAGEGCREVFCGTPTSIPIGSHGTACGSLAYGRTMGWAYNANKWGLSFVTSQTQGGAMEQLYDLLTVFHKVKPNHATKNNKNPTVLSMSWGMLATLNFILSYRTDNLTKYLTYRGDTTLIEASTAVVSNPTNVTQRKFKIKDNKYLDGMHYTWHEMADNSLTEAGNELIDAGVILVVASGNGNSNIVTKDHPNYNNFIHDDESTAFPGPLFNVPKGASTYPEAVYRTTSRRGYPLATGKTEDGDYPVIAVGALDSVFYQGKEIKAWYSSNGNGIDLWAPSEGVKSTTTTINTDVLPEKGDPPGTFVGSSLEVNRLDNTYAQLYPPSTTNSKLSAVNQQFGGTSGACPVAAGFLTTLLAHNRDWTWRDLKGWINNHLEAQPPETFYQAGGDPVSKNDDAWNFLPPEETFIKITYDKAFLGFRESDLVGTIEPITTQPKIPYLTRVWQD